MDILWLGDPLCHRRDLVGGKAAHLSSLAESYRVPPGFCLPVTLEFQQVLSGTYDTLRLAYQQLAERCGTDQPGVAVRSSAVDEDGSKASFAGLHETYLNVVGAGAVAQAAMACWQSARSDRALSYRREMGLSQDNIRLAVLVQQMVPADCSAVAFSANPVTGNPDDIFIEANWGLGESIVSGTASPDTYVLKKGDLRVRERVVGEKGRMTVLGPGRTVEVETPRPLRSRPALDGSQVAEVGALVRDLERRMGWPVDVEGAYAGGHLYLLQCRPVTKLGG